MRSAVVVRIAKYFLELVKYLFKLHGPLLLRLRADEGFFLSQFSLHDTLAVWHGGPNTSQYCLKSFVINCASLLDTARKLMSS